MLIAHRVELDPTDRQRTAFARAAGTTRFAYNWALTHSPTYNVHGTTVEAGLKMAKAQGERGAADLMRNVNPMVG